MSTVAYVLSIWMLAAAAQGAAIHVPADYPTIQAAIDASGPGDQIIVSPGVYPESLSIDEKQIDLSSATGPHDTIIDARQAGPVVTISNFDSGLPVHLSGFTFRHGVGRAGGIDQEGGTLVLENSEIVDNVSNGSCDYYGGGGIEVLGGATIRHNRFAKNRSDCVGGGIYVDNYLQRNADVVIVDNLIERNYAIHGGGVLALTPVVLVRNVIRDNYADQQGGGIAAWAPDMHVADNAVYGNNAGFTGGVAIALEQGDRGGQWANNTIVGNFGWDVNEISVGGYGSGVTFANNVVVSLDGRLAIHCSKTFDRVSPVFKRNDVYAQGNRPASGSCAQTATHGSDMHVDPQFADGTNGHPYHLAPTSPLIDAGMNAYATRPNRDLGGRPRIIDGGHGLLVDIGAYEFFPVNH